MAFHANAAGGLMGLGVVDDQAPISVGVRAENDPILSSASVIASEILLKMASVPRSQRVAKMREIMDQAQPGLGDKAVAQYLELSRKRGEDKKDQAMYDVVRSIVANMLATKTLQMAAARGISGLGQTLAEARGATSQGVNDANALFCSFGAGTMSMVGGVFDQFGLTGKDSSGQGGGAVGSMRAGAGEGAKIAGCGAGQLEVQNQHAQRMAQIGQSGTAQALAMQQAQDARIMRYAMIGGGGLLAFAVMFTVLKK